MMFSGVIGGGNRAHTVISPLPQMRLDGGAVGEGAADYVLQAGREVGEEAPDRAWVVAEKAQTAEVGAVGVPA